MNARIEVFPTYLRLIVLHKTKKRLDFAVKEAMNRAREEASIARQNEETRPHWIDGERVYIYRCSLLADSDLGPVVQVLAEDLTARGFSVRVDRPSQSDRMFGA